MTMSGITLYMGRDTCFYERRWL